MLAACNLETPPSSRLKTLTIKILKSIDCFFFMSMELGFLLKQKTAYSG
jgi:hypothetical protein